MPYHFVSKWVGAEKTMKEDTCFLENGIQSYTGSKKNAFKKKKKRSILWVQKEMMYLAKPSIKGSQ